MVIWVDADACPTAIREVLERVGARRGIALVYVANREIRRPSRPAGEGSSVRWVRVGDRFDAADEHIAQSVAAGDLVITADIPLAARIVERGATGLSPRGEPFSADNVGEKLAARDLMTGLREAGMISGGPPPFDRTAQQKFANALDRILTRLLR